MSADFWAGYISGAVGIIIGNPLDVLKVKLQAGVPSSQLPSGHPPRPTASSSSVILPTTSSTPVLSQPEHQSLTKSTRTARASSYLRPWITGTAAPVLGYGALNALLFVSYNRTEAFLNQAFQSSSSSFFSSAEPTSTTGTNLYTTWVAGAVGGLATWVVSTPTELIKCRVQLASASSPSSSVNPSSSPSSWSITRQVLRTEGLKGLYFGGLVTALRDSIGYGFYFWSYELSSRWIASKFPGEPGGAGTGNAASVLLCGGLAGIVTWASIFPLDVIKTRVQTQALNLGLLSSPTSAPAPLTSVGEQQPLLAQRSTPKPRPEGQQQTKPLGAWEITKQTYAQGGIKPFFRGLGVCSIRAFIVNAVQWAVYEWIMAELGVGRNRAAGTAVTTTGAGG